MNKTENFPRVPNVEDDLLMRSLFAIGATPENLTPVCILNFVAIFVDSRRVLRLRSHHVPK